jgi:cytochrome c oxidase assembly factor CtaG
MYTGAMTFAHGVATPESVWSAWTWEPTVIVPLAIAAALYTRGSAVLRRAGTRRTPQREAFFYAGLVAVFLALITPLDAVAEALFSVHMVQHLLLILVAAPLLVAGEPSVRIALAIPAQARRTWARRLRKMGALSWSSTLRNPLVVWSLHVVALWAWHLPDLYEAALANELIHALEHASFFGTAVLFWAVALSRSRKALSYPARILFVFTTALQSGALGALLIFAGGVLYQAHQFTAHDWGLTAQEDQQLAGALMWIPPWFVYFITMAVLFVTWLKKVERREIAVGTKP